MGWELGDGWCTSHMGHGDRGGESWACQSALEHCAGEVGSCWRRWSPACVLSGVVWPGESQCGWWLQPFVGQYPVCMQPVLCPALLLEGSWGLGWEPHLPMLLCWVEQFSGESKRKSAVKRKMSWESGPQGEAGKRVWGERRLLAGQVTPAAPELDPATKGDEALQKVQKPRGIPAIPVCPGSWSCCCGRKETQDRREPGQRPGRSEADDTAHCQLRQTRPWSLACRHAGFPRLLQPACL